MTGEVDSKILIALGEWEKKEGVLPRPLALYRELLGIQSEAKSGIHVTALSGAAISARMGQGRPLLEFDDLAIDWVLFRRILERVASVLAREGLDVGDLKNCSPELLESATRASYEGDWLPSEKAAESADLFKFALNTALQPFLSACAGALIGFVDQERWRRGFCPICGGSPDLAFLDKERGARWLLCSRCDTRWLFQRIECPVCGTQDQNALAYFTEDKGLYRLYVCDKCKCYLKAIDLRQTENEVLLPLERFFTLDLDAQARDKGYTSCAEAGRSAAEMIKQVG